MSLPPHLAKITRVREGLAPPEPPIVVEHRGALICLLREAAELEHAIMCEYLFAAFTLKQRADEGLSAVQLEAVDRWRKAVLLVARQEMLHFAIVQNLLTSIGAGPYFARPNLPTPPTHFPGGVQIELLPFGERAPSAKPLASLSGSSSPHCHSARRTRA